MSDDSTDRHIDISPFTQALRTHGGKRGGQLATLLTLSGASWSVGKYLWEKRNSKDFVITVQGSDSIYPDLHEWILDQIPRQLHRSLTITTSIGAYDRDDGISSRYDGSRPQKIVIEGHKVEVKLTKRDLAQSNILDDRHSLLEEISLTCQSAKGRDAIIRVIDGLVKERSRQQNPVTLHMPSRYGGEWESRQDLPSRQLENTILREGQLERLVDDFGSFLESEDDYNRFSQPWRRGYLFYGPPGTGKTSVARALANHYKMGVYYLPLRDIQTDTKLMSFISSIPPKSILLLEDIDIYAAATKREDGDKASLAALLNGLDGAWTPHGLVTIMTTNDRDALDEALVRTGRIDVHEEFGTLDAYQIDRFKEFFGTKDDLSEFIGRSPSDLVEKLSLDRRTGRGRQG